MFFSILSIVLTFGGIIACVGLCIFNQVVWYLTVIYSILTFIVGLGISFGAMCFTTRILGLKYLKTEDFFDKKRRRLIVDVAFFLCFWMNAHAKVENLDKVPKDTPFVIYVNHQAFVDMFLLIWTFRKYPFAFVYKEELEKSYLVGPIVKALGGESLDRNNDRHALESILNVIKKIKNGLPFLIYPEGRRSKGMLLGKYKPGAFKVVQKSKVPLVIVTLDGLYKNTRDIPFVLTPAVISITDVIEPITYSTMNSVELCEMVESKTYLDMERLRKQYWFLKPSKQDIKRAKKELVENLDHLEFYNGEMNNNKGE